MLGDLPLHPMLVHFTVVFILITALAQLAAVASVRFRTWIGWLLPAFAVLTAVTGKVTESLGEVLEEHLGRTPAIEAHAEMGEQAALFAIILGVLAVLHWLATADRLPGSWGDRLGFLRHRVVVIVVSVLCVGAAVTAIVFDVLAGHSGAVAVWLS